MKVRFFSALPITWVLLLSFVIANVTFASTTVSKTLNVSSFTGVTLANSYNVYIEQGSKQKVRAEGPEEVIDNISTEVKDGVWSIKSKTKKKYDRNWETGRGKVSIYITVPKLNYVAVAGSGNMKIKKFNTDDFKASIAGSGNITADITGDDITTKIAGSGNININGKGSSLTASIAGSGNVRGTDLVVKNVTAKISGSGSVKVHATSSIDASISGSGSVHYKGNPKISKKAVGSGTVRKI